MTTGWKTKTSGSLASHFIEEDGTSACAKIVLRDGTPRLRAFTVSFGPRDPFAHLCTQCRRLHPGTTCECGVCRVKAAPRPPRAPKDSTSPPSSLAFELRMEHALLTHMRDCDGWDEVDPILVTQATLVALAKKKFITVERAEGRIVVAYLTPLGQTIAREIRP